MRIIWTELAADALVVGFGVAGTFVPFGLGSGGRASGYVGYASALLHDYK
jgi:hypothetical protein